MAIDTANHTTELSRGQLKTELDDLSVLVRHRLVTTDALSQAMTTVFGASSASGLWNWRMAYDVMQASALHALNQWPQYADDLSSLNQLVAALPTETRRSEGQIRLQQFSTPLPYAATVVAAACVQADDIVLEPSTGTGNIAMLAKLKGASLQLNEVDPFRAQLLQAVFGSAPTSHDGEHIDDLLATKRMPSLVLMNPPFASSIDRSSDPHIAAKHVISAAKRLAPGGRLVAIVPMGFSPQRDAAHWKRLGGIVTPRMTIGLPGRTYRKMGTNVETQLLICDKVSQNGAAFNHHTAASLEEARQIATTHLPKRAAVPAAYVSTASKATGKAPAPKPARRPVAASTPRKDNSLMPVAYNVLTTPSDNPAVSDIYASYAPQRMELTDAQPHPSALVESIAMASVAPPAPSALDQTALRLPAHIVKTGVLSAPQLETVIMASDAFARNLPGAFKINEDNTQMIRADDDDTAVPYRMGFFLGDGTGCGKGRQVAGIMLTNWVAGRRRHVWVSKSATLIEDAIRDWSDLGGSPANIQPLSKWKPDQPITMGDGIIFVTYATLRSAGKDGTTRLQQLTDWAGSDFDGVIAFDEAHAMQNAAGAEKDGRATKPSQQGLAGLRLQLGLPRARVLYVSATGATSVQNLAYASRLGLWGQGGDYPFPSRESFVSSMEAGGTAAMEVVARDLKTLGLYTARSLSFDGVEYDVLEHRLSAAQVEIYDAYAAAFKTIHQNLDKALEATGVVDADSGAQSNSAKASAKSRFESTKQRFFNHLLMGMKAPTIIDGIKADIEAGWSAVVQIVSTGESLLKRRLDMMDPEDELVAGALTPRDYVLSYLECAFPIHAQKLVEMEDGTIVTEPLRDADGNLVVSREALALRDSVIEDLMTLAPIPAALDQLMWAFGDDQVAEVTGRSIRPMMNEDGRLFIEKRSASSNASETDAFMAGHKQILVFSDAGGTGRSYHAAITAKNQNRRRHYLLEPGWRADAAIQGFGRTNRTAQSSAPFYRLCTTNVHGEKRFTATISKRLDTLGALTKGQRETGGQGMFREEDNLESPIARQALRGLLSDLVHERAKSMSYDTFLDWTALRLCDNEGVLLDDLPPIQRFLNRVLALPIEMQNAIFEEFMERIALQTERARAAGTLDLGVETLRGSSIEQTGVEDLWTCPKTGAVTRIVGLDVTNPVHVAMSDEILRTRSSGRKPMINRASNRVALIDKRPMQFYDEDVVSLMRKSIRPSATKLMSEEEFDRSAWEPIDEATFRTLWDAEAKSLPTSETTSLFLLTGLLLPIWKSIPTSNERIYRVTPDGQNSMIGRTLTIEAAAALRARFMADDPKTPAEMLTVATGSTKSIDLGMGLSLERRRVAGEVRLEITGAEKSILPTLKAIGCFTEIIQFQLRLFVPHGDEAQTLAILAKISDLAQPSGREKAA